MGRLQPLRRHGQWTVEQHAFGMAVDVAGQQQALAIGLDLQYAGTLIAVVSVRPLPELKTYAVPLPLLATCTGFGVQLRGQPRRVTADYLIDSQTPADRQSAAGVIGVGMAEQHQIEFFHAQFAQ
ncbi:hypothetical protein D3C81_1099680 [compost metagenome]